MNKKYIFLSLGLFLIVLSSSGFLWMESIRDDKNPPIKDGQLDWN
ncbi:hypothetical protein [Lederbergia citrisecunda]|nr:hypothetical protein [Lederbergia citrisecunda]